MVDCTKPVKVVKSRREIEKSDFIVARQTRTDIVDRVISPKHFQVGIKNNKSFKSCLTVYGGAHFESGLSGSLQKLPDGTDYLRGANNITITNNLDGSITIGAPAGGFSGTLTNPFTVGDGVELSSGGSTFDGSSANTISVSLANNSGLGISGGKLKLDVNSLSEVTPAAGDYLLIRDNTDGSLKKINFSTISSAAQAAVQLNNPLSAGDGLSFSGGGSYDNLTAKTMGINFASNTGLAFNGSGELVISPSSATQINSLEDGDVVLVGDASDSGNVKKVSIANLRPSQINNLTAGSGLEYVSQNANFDNTSAETLRIKTNGSTISLSSSGIAVASTPGSITNSTGISALNFDGSSNASISIDTSVVPQLGAASNSFTGNIIVGGNLQTESLVGGDGNDLIKAGTNVSISKDVNHGTLTINATANVDIPSYANVAPTRNDQLVLHNGSSTIKATVANVSDLFDRTTVASSTDTVGIVSSNFSSPIEMNVRLSGNTLLADSSGISVQRVPRTINSSTGIKTFSFDGSNQANVAIDNSIVATLTGSNFTGDVKFIAGLSGSLQTLESGIPYIVGGSGIEVTTGSNGQVTVTALNSGGGGGGSGDITRVDAGLGLFGGGISGNVALSVDYDGENSLIKSATDGTGISVDNANDLILIQDDTDGAVKYINPSQISFAGGTIGNAEDGDYTDGLFTDFTTGTAVGTAIDRFNEILKSLAPSPANILSRINSNDTGVGAKLSFDGTNTIANYSAVSPNSLTPNNSLSNVLANSSYSSQTNSGHVRIACFNGGTTIDGILNSGFAADLPNFPANSLSDGNLGSLKLFVNDNSTPIQTVDLTSFASGNSLNAQGSGFNLSAALPGHFSDGTNFETFKHRTGSYLIHPNSQRLGWNYARVVHTISGVDRTTNYVEWVNDNNSDQLQHAGSQLINLNMTGQTQVSGVLYHTGGTATYNINLQNLYKNVFPISDVTFTTSNCSVPSFPIPDIDFGGGESTNKVLSVSRTATINSNRILNGSISVSTNVSHPLKNNLSGVGSASYSGILVYNLSNNSTATSETFRRENYRLIDSSYSNQAAVIAASNSWDPTQSLAGDGTNDNVGHNTGLMFYNQRLVSPTNAPLTGDFSSIANGPAGNVDYSSLTSGVRNFYRYFQNNTGGSKSNFSISINGNGTIVANSSALNGNKLRVFFKIPLTSTNKETGWMDLALPFANGQYSDNSGCLIGNLDNSLSATNNGSFGVKTVANGEYILIKIEADAGWSGHVSSISLNWS